MPPTSLLTLVIPGSSRKREAAVYHYRIGYRAPDAGEPGCVMTWNVSGGRMAYQVAAERLETGRLAWHCTCADAVYRHDGRHTCKHVANLLATMPLARAA